MSRHMKVNISGINEYNDSQEATIAAANAASFKMKRPQSSSVGVRFDALGNASGQYKPFHKRHF